MKQIPVLILLVLAFSLIGYSQTFTPPCLEYARSDVVFTGTVKAVEDGHNPSALFIIDKKFNAPAELKAEANSELMIHSPFGEESYEFVVDARYLAYASYDKKRNELFIPLDSRTGKLDKNGYDLRYLNSRINDRHSLSGMLIKLNENDAKTVQITARDEKGNQLKPKVDKWGRFETKALRPGKYSVELVLPFKVNVDEQDGLIVKSSSQLTKISYTAQVEIDRCAYQEILVDRDN